MTAITFNSKSWATLLACAGVTMSLPAASVPAPAAADSALEGGLEEITVTARRREEKLQNVPTSIVALLRLESIVYERGAAPWTVATRAKPETTHVSAARRLLIGSPGN